MSGSFAAHCDLGTKGSRHSCCSVRGQYRTAKLSKSVYLLVPCALGASTPICKATSKLQVQCQGKHYQHSACFQYYSRNKCSHCSALHSSGCLGQEFSLQRLWSRLCLGQIPSAYKSRLIAFRLH